MSRSGRWPAFLRKLIDKQPWCSACGVSEEDARERGGFLTGHHVKPFHKFPELELDEGNVVILCESRGGRDCHYLWGHLGVGWDKANPLVREMAAAMLREIRRARA